MSRQYPSTPVTPEMAAKAWRMPVAVAAEWLAFEPYEWGLAHAKVLHAAGLTPAQGRELYERVDAATRGMLARLVEAGRMASLDTANLHWWARAGLLTPQENRDRRGRVKHSFTPWVTAARRYITAAGGNERLGALAAAAKLSVEETATQFQAGRLNEDTLRVLTELADAGPLFALPPVV